MYYLHNSMHVACSSFLWSPRVLHICLHSTVQLHASQHHRGTGAARFAGAHCTLPGHNQAASRCHKALRFHPSSGTLRVNGSLHCHHAPKVYLVSLTCWGTRGEGGRGDSIWRGRGRGNIVTKLYLQEEAVPTQH